MKVTNPATGEIIREVPEDSAESIRKKFDDLAKGQKEWSKVPLVERINITQRFSDLLSEHGDNLIRVLTSEVGKPLGQSRPGRWVRVHKSTRPRLILRWTPFHHVRGEGKGCARKPDEG